MDFSGFLMGFDGLGWVFDGFLWVFDGFLFFVFVFDVLPGWKCNVRTAIAPRSDASSRHVGALYVYCSTEYVRMKNKKNTEVKVIAEKSIAFHEGGQLGTLLRAEWGYLQEFNQHFPRFHEQCHKKRQQKLIGSINNFFPDCHSPKRNILAVSLR